jgi:hypothetical protein
MAHANAPRWHQFAPRQQPKEAILNTASGELVTPSMPGDNIPESMGEDFSESVGDYISE